MRSIIPHRHLELVYLECWIWKFSMKSIFKSWFLGKFWFYLLFYIYFSTFQSSATNDDHSANNLLSELPRTTSTEFIPLIIVQLECQYSTRNFFLKLSLLYVSV